MISNNETVPTKISERAIWQNLWCQRLTVHCYPGMLTDNRVTVRFNEFPASTFPPQETLRFLENKINCFPDQDQSLFVITVEIVWVVKGKVCVWPVRPELIKKYDLFYVAGLCNHHFDTQIAYSNSSIFLIIWLSLLTYSLLLFTSQM